MKQVLILACIALMTAGFAADLKINGTMTAGLQSGTGMNVLGFGKSRITVTSKISDFTTFVYQQDLAGTGTFAEKLLYVDAMTAVGTLRVGYQVLGAANYYCGLYQNSAFYGKFAQTLMAESLMGSVAGFNLSVGYAGSTAVNSQLIGKAATNVSGYDLAVWGNYITSGSTSKSGLGLGVDAKGPIGPATVFGQLYMDSTDDTAGILGAGTARQVLNAGIGMDVIPGVNLYAEGIMGLNSSAKTNLGYDSTFKVGAKAPLNSDVLVNAELSSITNPTAAGAATTAASVGAQVNF